MKTLSFQVSDDEAYRIRIAAKRECITVSEFLRRRAAGTETAASPPQLVKCPLPGAVVFTLLGDVPPLTSASVREMLTDFP